MISARSQRIQQALNATAEISLKNTGYRSLISTLFQYLYRNDVGRQDVSQAPASLYQKKIQAKLFAKSPLVAAGLDEIAFLMSQYDIHSDTDKQDGAALASGETLLTLTGEAGLLLAVERTILNILQRLCGIALQTRKYVDNITHTAARIAGTRKTLLGLLDKRAIQCGGGLTHRLGLYDAVMLKENHLKILKKANRSHTLKSVLKQIIDTRNQLRFIEIEVTDEAQFRHVAKVLARLPTEIPGIIMFDHISPESIRELIAYARRKKWYDQILFEASGNITLDNAAAFAESGVDVLSIGALTHSVKAADLSLLFE